MRNKFTQANLFSEGTHITKRNGEVRLPELNLTEELTKGHGELQQYAVCQTNRKPSQYIKII